MMKPVVVAMTIMMMAVLLLVLPAAVTAQSAVSSFSFTQMSATAAWLPRYNMQLSQLTAPVTFTATTGSAMTFTSPLVLFTDRHVSGPSENDVWLSSDSGATWFIAAGVNNAATYSSPPLTGAYGAAINQSFAMLFQPITLVDNVNHILWLFGGANTSDAAGFTNTIWKSTNGGVNWNLVNPGATVFTPRNNGVGTIDSANAYYLGTGYNGVTLLNDIWRSVDGVTWTLQTMNAAFSARESAALTVTRSAVLNVDVLTLIGGSTTTTSADLDDIWVSTTAGTSWTIITASSGFSVREGAVLLTSTSGVIVFGLGYTSGTPDSDVWVSFDGGINFGQCSSAANISSRWWPSYTLDTTQHLIVAGGIHSGTLAGELNDVWRSNVALTDTPTLTRLCGNKLFVPQFGNGLQCWPPLSQSCNTSNGIVRTYTPLTFTPQTATAGFSPRYNNFVFPYRSSITFSANVSAAGTNAGSITYTGTAAQPLWIMFSGRKVGSGASQALENDVWASSSNGVTWQLISGVSLWSLSTTTPTVISASPYGGSSFTPLYQPTGLHDPTNDQLFLVGGHTYFGLANGGPTPNGTSQVWSSNNGGLTWSRLDNTTNALSPFYPRWEAMGCVSSTGQLFNMGGLVNASVLDNSVWTSTDHGFNWALQTAAAAWSARQGANVAFVQSAFGPQIMTLVSGAYLSVATNNYEYLPDVWSSSDLGVTWYQATAVGTFFGRQGAAMSVTPNNIIILSAGYNGAGQNDVLVSLDGGVTFGSCDQYQQDGQTLGFGPRWWSTSTVDQNGYFYEINGHLSTGLDGNDVWRSSITFNDTITVAQLCGPLKIPACGNGLQCWPPGAGTCTNACGTVVAPPLTFTAQSSLAPWSPRYDDAVKFWYGSITYTPVNATSPVTVTGSTAVPLYIVFGGRNRNANVYNDVWMSSNFGVSWNLIAGTTSTGVSATTTSFPTYFEMAELQDPVSGWLYMIGGAVSSGGATTSVVWYSTNGGVNWTEIDTASNVTSKFPARQQAEASAANGTLYISGSSASINDVWMSTDYGFNWYLAGGHNAQWSTRTAHSFRVVPSAPLGVNVLTVMMGSNNVNDVWGSTDNGATWQRINSRTPMISRNSAGLEVTANGMMIFTSGYSLNSYALDDLWVSLDGGITWGECESVTPFIPRWWPATGLEKNGYFIVANGVVANANGQVNEVWRSSFSFNNITAAAAACGNLAVPPCGLGIQCWPPSSTCVATCAGAPIPSSSSSSAAHTSSTAISTGNSAATSSAHVTSSATSTTTAAASAATSARSSSAASNVAASTSSFHGVTYSLGCLASAPSGAVVGTITLNGLLSTYAGPFNQQTFNQVFSVAMAAALSTTSSTVAASSVNCLSATDSNGNRGNIADVDTSTITFAVATPPSNTVLNTFQINTFNSQFTSETQISSAAASAPTCTSNCGGGGSSSLSSGAIAGIVIGGTVGLCCIIAILVIFCCGIQLRSAKKTQTNEDEHHTPQQHSQLEEEQPQEEHQGEVEMEETQTNL